MEILSEYTFSRPSKSRYAPVVQALLEGVDGKPAFAVRLKRGEDFPADANIGSVQGAISTQIRESPLNTDGRRAKTWVENPDQPDTLVVSLTDPGDAPAARKKPAAKRQARQAVVA